MGGLVILSEAIYTKPHSERPACAQSRRAMDIIFQGCSMSVFQQHWAARPARATADGGILQVSQKCFFSGQL